MPLIQCHLSAGLSMEQRKRLIVDLVEATTRTLGTDPSTITVILHEHMPVHMRELAFVPTHDRRPRDEC